MTSGSDPNRPAIEGGPVVILVEPQIGENIGAVARAMLNCGLTELRLVRPREGWPNPRAVATAAGADRVLDGARLYPNVDYAVADLLPLADALISIPLNPQFASLNLAQAVLLVAYEWFQTWQELPPERVLHTGQSAPATKAALLNLFEHLEQELDACRFFSTPDKRPSMVRNIRNAFERMTMTEQEVRTFHGIIAGLTGRRKGDS